MRRKQSGRASRRVRSSSDAVVAGAPDIDHHQARVVDAGVLLQRLAELGAREHGLLALDLLVDRHRRLHAGDVLPRQQRPVGQRERRLVAGVGGVVEEDGERLACAVPVRPFQSWTSALSGSRSATETNRVVGVTLPCRLRSSTARCTSSAVSGSSG